MPHFQSVGDVYDAVRAHKYKARDILDTRHCPGLSFGHEYNNIDSRLIFPVPYASALTTGQQNQIALAQYADKPVLPAGRCHYTLNYLLEFNGV